MDNLRGSISIMAISYLKKASGKPVATPSPSPSTSVAAASAKKFGKSEDDDAPVKKKSISWLKQGTRAKEAIAVDEARAEAAKAEAEKMWRFMMKEGEEADLTFLNGELDEDGMLDVPVLNEHTVQVGTKWRNFICVGEEELCPLCEDGHSRAALIGVLTVIDHAKHKIQGGPNKGKVLVNQRKLYPAKRGTLKLLAQKAKKHDGLAGCRFTVGRTDKQSPNVGNVFEFQRKYESYNQIASELNLKLEDVEPANVQEEMIYYTAEELIALGVAKGPKGPGYANTTFGSKKNKVNASELAKQI